ncbi:MAG: type I restriction enzyme HsdR N-terminal domain-containing protein [Nitrospirota bacterium]|nr:type I restriction enzyme HsdR N-terminal domain-containing protein [Nitrospirota bacterium]
MKPFFYDSKKTTCRKREFPTSEPLPDRVERPELPDKLTDCLTGREIPFSNRDNIRQAALRFLIEEKGYSKTDISVDRQVRFEIDGRRMISPVDIAIIFNNKTFMLWKCASGSLVSRERQIIAAARLSEDYEVPFSVVTNGKDLELLDTSSEKVIGAGFQSIPSKEELIKWTESLELRPVNTKRAVFEQRILYTYDSISSPANPE